MCLCLLMVLPITEHWLPESKPEQNEQWVHMGCDAEINLAVSHKASQRRSACVWEYLHTKLSSRGAHVFSEILQAHLPVRSEREKKWEWNEKNTHTHTHSEPDWSLAKYSHRNLTLADWLRPQSWRFCTWNGARCYFWAVTCWRNPRGRDRRRTLIQAPVLTATHTLTASMERVCMTQVCSPNRKQFSVDVC